MAEHDEDEQDAVEAKEIYALTPEERVDRDRKVLASLKSELCCFAVLRINNPPINDFTFFLQGLRGCSNLLVSAEGFSQEEIGHVLHGLCDRQFEDASEIKELDSFIPDSDEWFDTSTAMAILSDDGDFAAEVVPPDGLAQTWVIVAELQINRNGAQSPLRVVHVNLGPDAMVFWFLLPNGLLPRQVFL
ncbi:MAG: hypothetical protein ABSH48_28070 [Verrucomicrobiota bacterium]|jgi:hypothetical protein